MPALESPPGKIGPYRLLEKIGEGGMGVVYLARDAENRQVAVKVLGPAVASDPSARARLSREVETMRRVRSPHVAEILDADVAGPSPYIVTRYVPGRTLEDVVRANGPLYGSALQRLSVGLADALAAIHAADVVHRDLKPGNVMLLDNGEPVVIDFGIAHVPDATKLTQTGIVMGTPGYLAPEVIEGDVASGASDVHSWGATMAFAATGRQPFGTGTFQTIFFRVLQGKADLSGVPPRLLPLVTAALAPNPRARPTAAWLAAHCAGGPGATEVSPMASGPGSTMVVPDGVRPPWSSVPTMPPPSPVPPGLLGGEAALARPPAPPAPGPAEAAADVADLLPPVDYQRRANGGRPAGPGPAEPGMPRQYQRPVAGGSLVSLAFGVMAVAMSIALPVAGTLVSLAVITLLRAADRAQTGLETRRSVRGARPSDVVVVLITAPWTVVRALLTTVALAPLTLVVAALAAAASALLGHVTSLPEAGSWAAGAAVAWSAVGPGSRRPRRQLRRMSAGVLRSGLAMTVAIIACWALAAAAFSSAISQPPLLWPAATPMMPHLPSLGSALHTVQEWLLRRAVRVLNLP